MTIGIKYIEEIASPDDERAVVGRLLAAIGE